MGCNPIIYIRVDANKEIATGHVMRTLAIAKQIKRLGGICKFIVADEYAKPIILNNGFEVICLNSNWSNLDEEIIQMQQFIEKEQIKIILVDSYFVTKKYLEHLKEKVFVAYIDDLNLFKYPVHLLINYSAYYEMFKYETLNYNQETKFLLGCDYIPLREEFKDLVREKKDYLTNILITTGGTDAYHITYRLAKCLCRKEVLNNRVNLHIVVGRFNQDLNKIKKLAEEYSGIKVYQDISYMSQLMMECDIAVSAGGTTLFELCACGLPTICFAIADNQLMGIKALADKKLMYTVGDIRDDIESGIQKIVHQINDFIEHPTRCYEYSIRMQKLVDGKGAERIAECLLDKVKNDID
ncbi:MAG: UDP-2,4-diacetamido-2,4,6-trideoxy-beta-L-altropyranose hydrolase [Cellulosilyticum sp.]|nr:UDP-2,4-diacetamido-2,4,6-trideoxy-beta-L-altropyranose hydrolase [Cellulosilyticum sp.]